MTNFVICFLLLILYSLRLDCEVYQDRPKIKTSDGDLILEPAYDKNIYIKPNGPKSNIFIGNINILDLNITNNNGISVLQPSSNSNNDQSKDVTEILRRIENLESFSITMPHNALVNITYLNRRLNTLSNRLRTLQTIVNNMRREDECQSHPCENGGTCLNLASGYYCLCPKNWKGENCDEDINECKIYEGTDLGCQNGATCINRPGSYECVCIPGWFGLHCTRKERNCSGSDFEMCGHGTCLQVNTGVGIKCMCDQGWTTNDTSIACLTDVNECDSKQGARCSINPPVECINLPGTFVCGHCPQGYEGDGFICRDIDECLTQPNGGCSLSPKVSCYNTIGSRICGSCPSGYQGDGVTCTWRGSCQINRGGCHPSALCIETTGLGVQCACPRGMSGDGIGIHGCYIIAADNSTGCESSPCGLHGQCHPLHMGYTCICSPGYSGAKCDKQGDYCSSNPCSNGGTCKPDGRSARGYRCECTALYTGDSCQLRSEPCGGVLDAEEGSIIYPLTNTSYRHNTRCAWVIQTSPDKVINVTFSKFNLEHNAHCHYDFVQIHDGRSSASQLIGRFCGSDFPKGGNIISSHNNLYFWFRSDQTIAGDGFALHWTSIKPQCGGSISAITHGHISSPGSPGRYPPNRDCYWHLVTNLGKRIQLHFFELDLEAHANCSFDYLAVYDGLREKDETLLNKFCNSSQPAPLQSAGSEMLIHFHSDEYGSGKGFQITYAPVEGVPGCGGFFTADKGEIFSPLYDNTYLNNLLCDYKIQTRPDTKIRITFKSFNLERSLRCRYDYLEIYDGPSSESRLVGKFCGTTFPNTFISTSNTLFLQFKSDQSISSEGFKIAYESICHKTIIGDSGIITSPGYPFIYPKNTACEYVIETSPGKVITLTFQDFDIEDNRYYSCQYDYAEIRDGPTANSTLLGKYCGGSDHIPPTQTTTFNYLYLGFHSDGSISGTGFYANFTTLNTECGGVYRNITGLINYPTSESLLYSNDQSCSWLLMAPEGMIIKLSWNRFDIEKHTSCEFDSVELIEIDGNNYNNTLGKYCGTSLPPAITTSTNQLLIKFKSDNTLKGLGFSVSYTFLDEKTQCGGMYIKSHGFIYSPRWPNNYDANRDCIWTIVVPVGQQIVLNISDFDLEMPIRQKCDMGDFLEIRDGESQTAPLIGKFCGTFKSKRIVSTTHKLRIRFFSDFYISGGGFKIEWDGTLRGCGGTLTGVTGSIASPNYPQEYYDNAECFYKIVTSSGSRIRITFIDLELEHTKLCRDDHIEIFDGRDVYSPSLGRYCTMNTNVSNLETSSNYAFIKFRSDIFLGGKGFLLNYDTICHTNISGSYGIIESPGFPGNYPFNLNCLWSIRVGKGNKINVTFSHFDVKSHRPWAYNLRGHRQDVISSIPFRPPWYNMSWINMRGTNLRLCESDYLQFKNSNENDFSQRYCGISLPSPIRSKSNTLEIKFVSGFYNSDKGFRLEWVKDGCGTSIRKSFGSLTLSKKLRYISTDIECEWTIVTPPGTNVYLKLTEVLLEETKNCTVDAIELYNGPSIISPLLTKICNRGVYTVQASSNVLLLRFIKKSSLRDVYFSANFESFTTRCGGRIEARSGQIHSKNYPKNYDNNMDCLWYISVPKNHRIELNILDIDLYSYDNNDEEDCGDAIKIYEGTDMVHANYTHIICPRSNLTQIITNSHNIMVQFVTDGYGTAKGFKANFSATCGAVIEAYNDGIIGNDRYISNNYHNCTWVILSPKLDQKIKLTLQHISLPRNLDIITNRECPSSFVKIFDGNDVDAPLIGEYCGRKIPPMVVSHGSALTIVHGTYTNTPTGYFTAHYSTLSTACGGTLSSEEGSIASPNYPLSYPHGSDCEWIIDTSAGNAMYLAFEKFNLAYSEHCNEDYLEIRENDGAGNLLGVYCGDQIPTNTTKGTKLYLKFHSDNNEAGDGFLLHYGLLHNNDIIGLDIGEITSPLYPHSFEEVGEFSWRIITSGTSSITITVDKITIIKRGEFCDSKLIIYDGYDEEANVLEAMCGILRNEIKTLQSSSSTVYIKFIITEPKTSSMFHLKWSKTEEDIKKKSKKNCGFNQTKIVTGAQSVSFNSPNYPEEYNNDLFCEWIFEAEPSYHLSLTFNQVMVEETSECYADHISIYTRNNNSPWIPLKENVCLWEDLKKSIKSSQYLKVIFETDSTTSRNGFTAVVRSQCGGVIDAESGKIGLAWEDQRRQFEINKRCNWTITVRPGRIIKLEFEHFNITNESECTKYVMIRNGESIQSPLLGIGKYCGYSHESRNTMISSSNAVYVSYVDLNRFSSRLPKFQSSGLPKFQSFKLRYEELNIECGLTSSLDSDHKWEIISSPKYPNVPMPYSECVWIFTGPPGEILRVDFIDRFDVDVKEECKHEFIEIHDGTSELSPSKGLFCGKKPGTIKSSSNALYIKYTTRLAEPRNGFKANISIDVCGGTIVAESGELLSPGYPHMLMLPSGSLCQWHIISPSRHIIKIDIKDLNLPLSESSCQTKLTIEELIPANKTTVVLKEYCSEEIEYDVIETLTNEVIVKLYIDKSGEWNQISESRGFKLSFTSSRPTCGGVITQSEGFITTPGYPRETNLHYCQWIIIAPDKTRRIRLEVLDFNEDDKIGVYNDITFESSINIVENKTSTFIYESTENILGLYLLIKSIISNNQVHRFKAKYSSNEPALCGGPLDGRNGEISAPDLENSYVCKWTYNIKSNDFINSSDFKSIFISVNSSSISCKCRYAVSRIIIDAPITNVGRHLIFNLCGNRELSYRIPLTTLTFKAIQLSRQPLMFNMKWKLQPCGGVVHATEESINILNIPKSHNETVECGWVIVAPVGIKTETKIEGQFNLDCSDEFIKISQGQVKTNSDSAITYCKDNMSENSFIATSMNTYIQYHSKGQSSNIQLFTKTVSNKCGGLLLKYDRVFTSPYYPKNYKENEECIWEIQADIGYRVSLSFMNRFVVEETSNCTKDVVIIYDWRNESYSEIARICGRHIPPVFNSTLNRMKVIFRTDGDVNLDGFSAMWVPICGGMYTATEQEQVLYSPGYTAEYKPSLDCTYKISASNKKLLVKFEDFDIEGTYPECRFDNVSISAQSDYNYLFQTYCGKHMPPLLENYDEVTIHFQTDRVGHRKGFRLTYSIYSCGGKITEPTSIKSGLLDTYYDLMNCTWTIEAPIDKVVIVKFAYIDLESHVNCLNDYISVFDGPTINNDKQLALLCGHINSSTVIKTKSRNAVVQFISDAYLNYRGFQAQIIFSYSESVGCGGFINLLFDTQFTLKSPLIGKAVVYENYLDCHWSIKAPKDHVIKVTYSSFHISPCDNVNQTAVGISKCDCDFVEIKDGVNPDSLVIGTFCGHTLPPEIVSSSNTMGIRLSTDGEIVSSGFEIHLSVQRSACSQSVFTIDHNIQTIRSPGFHTGRIPRGLHCTYTLHVLESYSTVHLRVNYLDLQPGIGNNCKDDRLIIRSIPETHNLTLGKDYILNRYVDSFFSHTYFYDSALAFPEQFVLCGANVTQDFYLNGGISINLITSAEAPSNNHYKGVEIEASLTDSCGRNHTEAYGRIQTIYHAHTDKSVEDCYTLITAPDNYTISIYIITMYPDYFNSNAYFEIFDGDKRTSPLLLKVQNEFETRSVFSTGTHLLLHNHLHDNDQITYDLNYIVTNKGQGCGGKLISELGRFTSPMYPGVYRKRSSCEWEAETPPNTRLLLHFSEFDLGVACGQNYLSIVDRNGRVMSTFCDTTPADYTSPDNYVKVIFTTTMNNGGTGWVADFVGIL